MTNPTPETTAQPPVATCSRTKKTLSVAFNMAVGFGLTYAAKAAVVAALITAPAWVIPVASIFVTATIATLLCHEGKRYQAKKESGDVQRWLSLQNAKDICSKQNLKSIFNKQNAKVFVKSAIFAGIGSALAIGFHDGIIQDGWHKLFGSTPAHAATLPIHTAVVTPVHAPAAVAAIPLAAHCPTPLEHFTNVIDHHHVSARVQEALHRAASANPHVAAQGTKDLAYFAFNGLDGVPKNPNVALELFQKAADAGNVQAKIDLLYTQFHGLAGVHADPQAAVDAMKTIHTPRAAMFIEQWGKMGHVAKHAAKFSSKAVLNGVKLCAPAA